MSVASFFVEMPGQIEPFETPFDRQGHPPESSQFVYVGNRTEGRYSGLLPMDYDWRELGWGLAEYFPQGYANLLRLEKIYAAHPDLSVEEQYRTDNRCWPKVYKPGHLTACSTSYQVGDITYPLFVVLREPVSRNHTNDTIGIMYKIERALKMAERYASTYGRRAVVGKILANMTWH